MGFENVSTFRASGNVVFEAPSGGAEALARKVERGLKESLGYEVEVFLRTAKEMRALAAEEPFSPKRLEGSKGKPQVVLLGKRLDGKARKRLGELSGDNDRLIAAGKEIHWLPAGGLAESELGMEGITKAFGPNTVRTKGTINQITAKYLARGSAR